MEAREIAEEVRSACVEAALRAYEDAGISGLCAEGRWELAIDAVRHLDLTGLRGNSVQPPGPTHPAVTP